MKPDDEEALLAGLKALRDRTIGEEPSPSLETALLGEFRRHRQLRNEPKPGGRRWLWAGLAAVAAVLIALIATNRQETPRQTAKVDMGPRIPDQVNPPRVQTTVAAESPKRPVRARRRVQRSQPTPQSVPVREVATEFLPMPYAPQFMEDDRGQMVRVRLPRESMRTFGLPVNQDRILTTVKADVLVGEDGIARAIRFVQ